MQGIEEVVNRIQAANIEAEIWVDGSFLTHKPNPNDSDVLVRISSSVLDQGTDKQRELIEWIQSDLKPSYMCDSYVLPVYPSGHSHEVLNDYMRAYWLKQFGFSRGEELKGIAVLAVGMN